MHPTPDSFQDLARSSPWRWGTVHFTHRGPLGEAEAWVRRPGRLRVRVDGREHRVDEALEKPTVMLSFERHGPHVEPELPQPEWPHDVTPLLRADGLVAERPDGWWIQYGDPMWQNYTWVALLDPVELSHDVTVTEVRADVLAGRSVWRARLRALDGYDPRCPCCPLLWSEVSDREEYGAPRPDHVYPEGYDVALDLGTGVVVSLAPVGESTVEGAFEVDIHEVDADVDHLFPSD